MSDETAALTTPCGHEPPQSAAQLHGVCIFCWRDRAARIRIERLREKYDFKANLTAALVTSDKRVKALEAENAELRDALKLAKEFAQVEVDEFNKQAERIAKLEAALRPLAEVIEGIPLKKEDVNRARAALASPSEPAGGRKE